MFECLKEKIGCDGPAFGSFEGLCFHFFGFLRFVPVFGRVSSFVARLSWIYNTINDTILGDFLSTTAIIPIWTGYFSDIGQPKHKHDRGIP